MRHFPSPLSANADSWVEYLQHNTSWVPLGNRYKAWCTDCSCPYMYSGNNISPQPILPGLKELGRFVAACAHKPIPNCAHLNLYRSGRDGCGWHSDDEKELGENPVIASVSLGASRRFLLRHRRCSDLPVHEVTLEHGSLLLMQGTTQKHWRHSVPRMRNQDSPRLNLTFRRIN